MFPLPVQWILTVLIPIGFAGYYPAEGVMALSAVSALAWLAFPVGLLVLTIGLVVWHTGLARYQSAGS